MTAAPELENSHETLEQLISASGLGSAITSDPELLKVFVEEAGDLLASSADTLQQWSADQSNLDLVRALQLDIQSLKRGASLAGVTPIADLAQQLDKLLQFISDQSVTVTDEACNEACNLAVLTHDALGTMAAAIGRAEPCTGSPDLVDALEAYLTDHTSARQPDDSSVLTAEPLADTTEAEAADHDDNEPFPADDASIDPAMLEIFLEEAREIMLRSGETIHTWSEDMSNSALVEQLQRDLHTLKGGARMAEIKPVGDLSHQLETLFEGLHQGTLSANEAIKDLVNEAHDHLTVMVENVAQGLPLPAANELIAQFQESGGHRVTTAETGSDASESATSAYTDLDVSHVNNESYEVDNLDPELISLFLEEAEDLVNSTADNLQSWLEDLSNISEVKTLQRALHTLKGGARLAGLKPVGDLSHELENLFEGIVENRFRADKSLARLLLQCHDRLAEMVDCVASGQAVSTANELILRINHYCQYHGGELTGGGSATTSALASAPGQANPEELRTIFLQEAQDIMATSSNWFDSWKSSPDQYSTAKQLGKEISTLMAGAKLASAGQRSQPCRRPVETTRSNCQQASTGFQ